jgi:CheY-like chemotaxis protein
MMVAICQRAALFREALASVVTSRGHEVVCCVSTLADAVRAVERSSVDVLLLDASLSERESLARLRQELGLRVLLLTESGEDGPAADALEAGLADAVLDHAVALVNLQRAVNAQPTVASRPPQSSIEATGLPETVPQRA